MTFLSLMDGMTKPSSALCHCACIFRYVFDKYKLSEYHAKNQEKGMLSNVAKPHAEIVVFVAMHL